MYDDDWLVAPTFAQLSQPHLNHAPTHLVVPPIIISFYHPETALDPTLWTYKHILIMTEALGVVSSIIAILQLTSEAVEYTNGAKDATSEATKIRDEIDSTGFLLTILKGHADQNTEDRTWFPILSSLAVENGPLDQFKVCWKSLPRK
jgi:hypothetical protein